jgi:hypothetical protein
MNMIGKYLRVTPTQLLRVIEDPEWAREFARELEDAEDAEEEAFPLVRVRRFSTDKAWELLAVLLGRADFPVDVVFGEEPFDEDGDRGYGPPRYLPVERVRTAAELLGRTSYDSLVQGVDRCEPAAAEAYPLIWDGDPESLEWARGHYTSLVMFFEGAAHDGDAMLLWLD